MPIPDWLRNLHIWHPTYGKCGGQSHDCSDHPPQDKMDFLFEKHDKDLEYADKAEEKENRERLLRIADRELACGLRGTFGTLEPYRRPIYGPVYNFFAKMVFRP